EVDNILTSTRYLLSRYFLGICLEILIMMTMITAFLTILGVKGALLIGFLGGLMNIIPYLGPVIGAILGVLIGASTQLSLGVYADLYVLIFKIVGSFSVAKLIDDMVLQPMIYSKSVKAHPLEIFLVIMIAGSLAGVPGMMLAIPSYTVLRIVAKEFLSGMRVVKKLTEDI
ncbi:MAG TPA: AI-2E family transporter, partial [Bacteroidales bacterium]|nr:AI-2E family transporter [Bacteroidales bacterium]